MTQSPFRFGAARAETAHTTHGATRKTARSHRFVVSLNLSTMLAGASGELD
jgi:hypothetical protein